MYGSYQKPRADMDIGYADLCRFNGGGFFRLSSPMG